MEWIIAAFVMLNEDKQFHRYLIGIETQCLKNNKTNNTANCSVTNQLMKPDIRTKSIFINVLCHYSAMLRLPWMCYNPNVLSHTKNGTFVLMQGDICLMCSLCNILIFHASTMFESVSIV